MTGSLRGRAVAPRTPSVGPGPRRWAIDGWVCVALATFALALLRAWSYPGPYPGEAARMMTEQAGLWPQFSPQAPVWTALARWLAGFGAEGFHGRLQWMGHLFVAAAVGLLYRSVLWLILAALEEDAAPRWSAGVARAAAAGSSVFLLVSPPVWRAAQSPHPAALGLFLGVAASAAAIAFATTGARGLLLVWAVIAGVGVVESPLVLVLLPAWLLLFALLPFGILREAPEDEREHGTLWGVLALCVFAGAAVACLLGGAAAFQGTEGHAMRGGGGVLRVGVRFWDDYFGALRGALPKGGGVAVLLTVVAPFLLVCALSRRVQNGEFGLGLAFLYVMAIPATVLQVAGSNVVRVWTLLPTITLQAGSCLVSAATFGLVVAAWLLVAGPSPAGQGRRERDEGTDVVGDPSFAVVLWRALAGGCVGFGMLLAVGASLPERAETRERQALATVGEYARQVVADAGSCPWVVTDGLLDAQIRLAAWEVGSSLQALPLPSGIDPWTRKAVLRRLPDDGSRSFFALGADVLLRSWFAADLAKARGVAVQTGYDVWLGAPVAVQPEQTLFLPTVDRTATRDTAAILVRHVAFWSAWQRRLDATKGCTDAGLVQAVGAVRRHLACVANELGVRLEDEGAVLSAVTAYTAARELNPDNLSARLNALTLARLQAPVPRADELEAEIRALAVLHSHATLRSVVRQHGDIRNAGIQAALGAAQAFHSVPGALLRVERALRLMSEGTRSDRRLRMLHAGLRWRNGDADGGRAEYARLLDEGPNDVAALLGMAVLDTRNSGLVAALPLLARARAAGGDPRMCDELGAVLSLEAGDPDAAAALMEPHALGRASSAMVWYLLAQAALASDDPRGVVRARTELERFPNARGLLALLAAQEAEHAGDLSTALARARVALIDAPTDERLLAAAVRLCVEQDDYVQGGVLAERLLRMDPTHGLANFVVGTARLLAGSTQAAKAHLVLSVTAAPSVAGCNNLAVARLRLREFDEARQAAEMATSVAPWHPDAWRTLVAVALAQGDVAAARGGARRVASLAAQQPSARVTTGEGAFGSGVALERIAMFGLRAAFSHAVPITSSESVGDDPIFPFGALDTALGALDPVQMILRLSLSGDRRGGAVATPAAADDPLSVMRSLSPWASLDSVMSTEYNVGSPVPVDNEAIGYEFDGQDWGLLNGSLDAERDAQEREAQERERER